MKKSNISGIVLLALVGAAYVSSALRETNHPVVTNPADGCDPNYSGCVPIASDVDCAGGAGNGPAYVTGPIRVIGTDIYHLDGNNDGVACE